MFFKGDLDSFHNSIKYIIKVAQIFGLLPISCVLSKKYENVTFKWRSAATIYSLLIISGTAFMTILALYRLCLEEFQLHVLDSFIFNLNGLSILILFFKLAMQWPKILTAWGKQEYILRSYSYYRNTRRHFIGILIFVTVAATVEHFLAMVNTYLKVENYNSKNITCMKFYFIDEYPFVFDYIPFSLPLGIYLMFVNWCNVFGWNFIDAFIMIISLALSYKFKQVYFEIKSGVKKNTNSIQFWEKIREDYNKVTLLCIEMDTTLSYIIVLSFSTNLYFIITQLYKSLVDEYALIDKYYFVYSFGWLVTRTAAVILYGDMINRQARRPLPYLLSAPSSIYNSEIKRFISHIHIQDICFTGNRYFFIRRQLILKMVATVITYELFMLQSHIIVNL